MVTIDNIQTCEQGGGDEGKSASPDGLMVGPRALSGLGPGPLWAPFGPCGPGPCGLGPCGPPGPLCAPLGPCGPPWALVGSPGPLWASLGSCGPPWSFEGRALEGRALVGWALVAPWALVGQTQTLVGRALVRRPLWALWPTMYIPISYMHMHSCTYI